MVGATGIEPVTPSMSTRCSPGVAFGNLPKIVKSQLLAQCTIFYRATQSRPNRRDVGTRVGPRLAFAQVRLSVSQ
jgi:hypothetical protein